MFSSFSGMSLEHETRERPVLSLSKGHESRETLSCFSCSFASFVIRTPNMSSTFDNLALSFWIRGIHLFLQSDGSLRASPWLAALVMDLK
jgi:hypothetical protein